MGNAHNGIFIKFSMGIKNVKKASVTLFFKKIKLHFDDFSFQKFNLASEILTTV